MDGDTRAMSALRADEIYWRYDLTAVGAFITRENINQLFHDNGFSGEIGLLSVDIDAMIIGSGILLIPSILSW